MKVRGKPGRTQFDEDSNYRKTHIPVTEEEIERHLSGSTRGSQSASIEKNSSATPDQIRAILANNMYWYQKPVPKTDEEIADRLNEFFSRLSQTGEIPMLEKLSLALGVTSKTVLVWANDEKNHPARCEMIRKAREMIKMFEAELAMTGKIPPITYIFRSKNYYDMADTQDIVVSAKTPLDESTASAETLAERYRESIVIEGQATEKA